MSRIFVTFPKEYFNFINQHIYIKYIKFLRFYINILLILFYINRLKPSIYAITQPLKSLSSIWLKGTQIIHPIILLIYILNYIIYRIISGSLFKESWIELDEEIHDIELRHGFLPSNKTA